MRRNLWALSAVIAAVLAPVSLAHAAISTISLEPPTLTSVTDSNGATYSLTATQPTGSGIFRPFMRIQRTDDSQGYNSSLNNGPNATMDLINLPGNSSSTLVMSNVVTDQNTLLLTLDYNEQGKAGKSLINLEDLVLVVSTDPNKTGPAGPGNNEPWSIQSIPMSAGDQVIYSMSTSTVGGDPFNIQLNADNNPANGNGGSGAADLNVSLDLSSIPNLASLVDSNHYLYVYSRFGNAGAGFEEWSAQSHATNVPEPASLAVLSLGAIGLLARRRKA